MVSHPLRGKNSYAVRASVWNARRANSCGAIVDLSLDGLDAPIWFDPGFKINGRARSF